jgi:hypothetical protein
VSLHAFSICGDLCFDPNSNNQTTRVSPAPARDCPMFTYITDVRAVMHHFQGEPCRARGARAARLTEVL